jgi:sulfur carrier protein
MSGTEATCCGSEDLSARAQTVEVQGARTIVVNGEGVTTATLHDLLAERGLADVRVATARNGEFVPERTRAATALQAGDHIEIVSPRHGG